jgi:hypothetical protein
VVVRNRADRTRTPRLTVLAGRRRGDFPVTVWVDDGNGVRSHVFEKRHGGEIELSPMPPDSERLVIIWTDKAWKDRSRRLGVRIRSGEWTHSR